MINDMVWLKAERYWDLISADFVYLNKLSVFLLKPLRCLDTIRLDGMQADIYQSINQNTAAQLTSESEAQWQRLRL